MHLGGKVVEHLVSLLTLVSPQDGRVFNLFVMPLFPPSLSALRLFCRWTWVSQYQSVSILDVIGDKSDGGGEW